MREPLPNPTLGSEWELVGRAEELDLLRQIRSASSVTSALMTGAAGVGKSRLARTTAAEAAEEGWATITIRGSSGLANVPLGPLRTVLQIVGPEELSDVAAAVERELLARRSARGLFVLADDGQELDDTSAAVLQQLAAAGLISLLVTARSGLEMPAALTTLWKDGLAQRLELQNLSKRETLSLLSAGLGGPVQESSADRMWLLTEGNPMYLREVILSGVETSALQEYDGEWRWSSEWATGSRLQEIVATRLGRLDPDSKVALEIVSLAGALPLSIVTRLTTSQAIEELEARSLVTTERVEGQLEITIAHALHAEVLRNSMPTLQKRALWQNLVGALSALPIERTADRVRLACWSLEAGIVVDPVTLVLGSTAALFGLGSAVSGRLHELFPDQVAVDAEGKDLVVRRDHELALALAQAAYDRTGGVTEGIALVDALAWSGAADRAESILVELAQRADKADDRVRLALVVAWIRFWVNHNPTAAVNGLQACLTDDGSDCLPQNLSEVYQQLAGIALNTAKPRDALSYAQQSADTEGVELERSASAAPAAAALLYLGRCREAIALADAAVPIHLEGGHPLSVATLLFAKAGALVRAGRVEEATALAEWLRGVALSQEILDAAGIFGVLVGEVLLRAGKPVSSLRLYRDAAGLLAAGHDHFGYRPWALLGVARCKALVGEEEAGRIALAEAAQHGHFARHFEANRYLAEMELDALAGRVGKAEEVAREGVAWARNAEMVIDEAYILDVWSRLAPSKALAERLTELTTLTDSELVEVIAENAHALVNRDPGTLLAVSDRYAAMHVWWNAAEAAAMAATFLQKKGQTREANAAARTAADRARHCEGAIMTATTVGEAAPLTKRERQVAGLAAAGRSNREIAELMVVSPRTVENHLYRVYLKLGVTDRLTLAAALKDGSGQLSE
jgi:DNA-binding CsgD family transcriptional regulator